MAKTRKGACARGTIYYANEALPYGEATEHSTHTHTQKHVSRWRAKCFPLIFMLNLQSLVNAISSSDGEKAEENRARTRDG